MSKSKAVVIGCGVGGQGRAGVHSIGYLHGETYKRSNDVELVAAADIVEANAVHYAEYFGFERTYTDYKEMLETEKPDIVSVCVWPPLHAEMATAAANAGAKGIWCEKPMALSMGDVDRITEACENNGSKLVVNHQRRYLPRFQMARKLIAEGAIGDVLTIHAGIEGWDLLSWGTHWVDMYRFLLGEETCDWVVAQVDAHSGIQKYGHYVEDHALSCFGFQSGAHGFLEVGRSVLKAPAMRVSGTDGMIDIAEGMPEDPSHELRYMSSRTDGWVSPALEVDTNGGGFFGSATDQLLADLVAWIEGGPEPAVGITGARATTEMIMASYESARTGLIIDLPLEAKDFPLTTLVEKSKLHP